MKETSDWLLSLDARLSKRLRKLAEPRALSWIMKFFAHSGDSWFWLAGLFLVWLFSDGPWRDRAAFLAVGLLFMAAAVIGLKFIIRRPRPEGEWGLVYRITDPHSFPSGHAARSAALLVMGFSLGPAWFAIALLIWAPWVGISRVALGVHYLLDVVAGWLVGAGMGLVAVSLYPGVIHLLHWIYAVLGI